MRHLFSKFELGVFSSMIATVILLGSLSLTAGIVVVSGPAHPELTVNICQPRQASCRMTITLLARPATAAASGFVLSDLGSIVIKVVDRLSADPSAPDTPPPKQLV